MIRLEHVRKVYPNVTPLSDINAEINAGDVISVIGPSGTGKSTLLRCINMLERPDGGKNIFWGHGSNKSELQYIQNPSENGNGIPAV